MMEKMFFKNFAFHFSEAAIALLLNILGNWLSNTSGQYFEWSTGAITAKLISVILLSLIMYAVYKTVWSKANNVDERFYAKAANTFISQGLIYSLVTVLYSWCSSSRSVSLENTLSLLISLSPYVQGHVEVAQLHKKVSMLYDTAHGVLDSIRERFRENNQPVRIHQNWLMDEMRKRSVTNGLDANALRHFSATKLATWKDKDADLEIGKDSNDLLFVYSRR